MSDRLTIAIVALCLAAFLFGFIKWMGSKPNIESDYDDWSGA